MSKTITLTKSELEKLLKRAYSKGYHAGYKKCEQDDLDNWGGTR